MRGGKMSFTLASYGKEVAFVFKGQALCVHMERNLAEATLIYYFIYVVQVIYLKVFAACGSWCTGHMEL